MEEKRKRLAEIWTNMQKKAPLVHCITNAVTVNDCANILLAAGARPTMAHDVAEAKEVTGGCDALVCNFGATDAYEAMFLAAEEASKSGHPIVVDPVGAGGSSFRREKIKELFARAQISCIRGNASEMRAVFENSRTVTGVDAREEDKTDRKGLTALAMEFAKRHHCICVISGEEDVITDGTSVVLVKNGHKNMSRITGTGCMSSVLLGATFAAETSDKSLENLLWAAITAVCAMGICGEIAARQCEQEESGTMSFRLHMIDEMSMLNGESVQEYGRIEINDTVTV